MEDTVVTLCFLAGGLIYAAALIAVVWWSTKDAYTEREDS